MSEKRLFIVANRLPVSITTNDNDKIEIKPSSGGLVSAVTGYLNQAKTNFTEVYWAGVPGCTTTEWKDASGHIPASTFTYLPVMVHKELYEKYYNGFSNSIIWPLFHYFPSYAEYNMEDFDAYLSVNERFADLLLMNCREGDTVWIHDYHLMPLAAMLRNAMPEITIGFFLHIPFPSYELIRMLPRKWQEGILQGMLGADLIGFHTMDYASHFLQSLHLVLGVDNDRNVLRYNDRLIKTDVFPISIDYEQFNSAYDNAEVVSRRESFLEKMNGRKIIFSVDRLDYTKGVHNRLKAYEYFLQQNPDYHDKVVFIIVVVPSRDNISKYAERKRMINELISRINSLIGNLHWQPVVYQYNYLEFNEMLSLYTSCDLALITPLRDGMNLVSKEFVASRKDKQGVLIISEMAGAARELTDALTINPNDTIEMAQKIKEGLCMSTKEQHTRMEKMQKRVASYDVKAWADDFMAELNHIKQRQKNFQETFLDEFAKRTLLNDYRTASRRLLLLDYDGTLVPFSSSPEMAIPGAELLDLLTELGSVPSNDVFLISGRSSSWLDSHFASLPIHLIAEHGARHKWKAEGWVTEVSSNSEWKNHVQNIMEIYERRCPHSFVEEKEFSIVWHYRNANSEQGKLRAVELVSELKEYIHNRNLEVMAGNKIVEVRNKGIDKGSAIKKVLSKKDYDFIFAVGDDKTDEDMFKTLAGKKNVFTIKVGPNASYAQYNLLKPQMVISLLEGMKHLPVNCVV